MAEFVLPPVQEEPGRLRRDSPVVGAGDTPPLVNAAANLIHGGGNVVLLLLGGDAQPFVDDELLLFTPGSSSLPGLGNWRDKLGPRRLWMTC